MLLSKSLIKKTVWLSILAIVYAAAGLPLVHPFFHHHCEKQCCIAGGHDLNRGFSNGKQPLKELQRHPDCPICSFFQHFYINHPTISSANDYEKCFSKGNLPLTAFLIKQFKRTDLFPRPPPPRA